MNSINSRDVKEGEFCHVCRTEARHVFNVVVSGVVLLLEEGFVIFRVDGGPSIGHGHVNKGSFASVFEEVNFLDHFSEKSAIPFLDNNAYCLSSIHFAMGPPFWFHNFCCNMGECVAVTSAESGIVLFMVK